MSKKKKNKGKPSAPSTSGQNKGSGSNQQQRGRKVPEPPPPSEQPAPAPTRPRDPQAPLPLRRPQDLVRPTAPVHDPSDTEHWAQVFEDQWDQFEEIDDYEEMIAFYQSTMRAGVISAGHISEMLSDIYEQATENDDYQRFDGLLDMLQQNYPDAYAHDETSYLEWRIANALATNRARTIPPLFTRAAELALENLEGFLSIYQQLAYHGQTSTIASCLEAAWPSLQAAADKRAAAADDDDDDDDDETAYDDEIISELADLAADYVVFDYLEHTSNPSASDPQLHARLEPVLEPDEEELAHYLELITGQSARQWEAGDFVFPQQQVELDEDEKSSPELYDLSIEFLGYLRREEGIAYSRGELARAQIERYILMRQANQLAAPRGMLDRVKESFTGGPSYHFLCPDAETFDIYLSGLSSFMMMQRYKAIALLELIPAWLRFLLSRQLIDQQQQRETLRELREVVEDSADLWEEYPADPDLGRDIERAWKRP